MKMSCVLKISHGTILSRIRDPLKLDENARLMLTMQDLSYYSGIHLDKPQKTFQKINPENLDKCLFGKKNDVVIGLTVNKAMVIEDEFDQALIPSNFALITIESNDIDPFYLMWYFNESADYRKYAVQINQGSYNVKSVSINELRDLDINFPSIENQIRIGNIYKAILKREKLIKIKNDYIISLLKGIDNQKKEIKNG
jgi:hypothetical protein